MNKLKGREEEERGRKGEERSRFKEEIGKEQQVIKGTKENKNDKKWKCLLINGAISKRKRDKGKSVREKI